MYTRLLGAEEPLFNFTCVCHRRPCRFFKAPWRLVLKKCIFSLFYSSFLHQWYFPVHCPYLHASPAAINQSLLFCFLFFLFFTQLLYKYIFAKCSGTLCSNIIIIRVEQKKKISICIFLYHVLKSNAASEAFVSSRSWNSYFPVVGCGYSNPYRANKLPANKLWKETRGKKWIRSLWKLANEITHRLLCPPAAVMARNWIGKGSC